VLSEALYLKKPIFSLPIKNQFEQMMNGKFIQQLGVGEYHTSLDVENLEHFFNNLKNYQKNARSYDPGNQHETLHQIEQKLQRLVASSGS
jgi:uncharacterized protein (TIGR00661 family)